MIEKSIESEFPGVSFRPALSGREAYVVGHRVAVWEVVDSYAELKSISKTAAHYRWPSLLVKRALDFAKAFPRDIKASKEGEGNADPALGG